MPTVKTMMNVAIGFIVPTLECYGALRSLGIGDPRKKFMIFLVSACTHSLALG
jgi:hypothetical protein